MEYVNLYYSVTLPTDKQTPNTKDAEAKKIILDKVSGFLKAGKVTAIMGSSGKPTWFVRVNQQKKHLYLQQVLVKQLFLRCWQAG
jgi:hypothetical protein